MLLGTWMLFQHSTTQRHSLDFFLVHCTIDEEDLDFARCDYRFKNNMNAYIVNTRTSKDASFKEKTKNCKYVLNDLVKMAHSIFKDE